MKNFKHFAKQLLTWRLRFISGLVLAAVSALGLGVGLLSLGPALSLILDPENGKNLIQLAEEHNASNAFPSIPEGLISTLPEGRFDGVLFILIGLGGLTIFGGLANFLHQYISAWLAMHVVARARFKAFTHVLYMPVAKVARHGSSEFVSRIIRDAEALQVGLLVLMGRSVSQFTKGIVAFMVACVFDYRLVIIALIVLPVLVITLQVIGRRVNKGTRASLSAQQELLRISNEAVQGLKAVKVNTAESTIEREFEKENAQVVKSEMKVRVMRALSSPLMETLAILVLGTLAGIAAHSIIDGSLQFNRFLLSIGALAVAGSSLRPLAGLVTEIQAAEAPAARLMEILNASNEEDSGTAKMPTSFSKVAFQNVSFTYENKDVPAVNSFSAEISAGERVAVVGPNGSGKTSLVSLIPRLLSQQEGSIFLDNTNINDIGLKELRTHVGVVTQETVLFHGTIADNIRFGTNASDEEVRAAANYAHADEFIAELDGGYDSLVYEQGKSLSGGQRQRIAIARVLLRNPSIMIFDEATSQIDAESEAFIADTLEKYSKGKTVFVIAHRMSTVQNADRILVLDEGKLVGNGTHQELLDSCDVYRRLTETQLITAMPNA
ncbi:MAG: ABC transporter ATP-binding protein/permease [Phycisphaerales bacterium]|nr:ABC transporter ATP-binding protein/permease [Phycisphaerales bacterium]